MNDEILKVIKKHFGERVDEDLIRDILDLYQKFKFMGFDYGTMHFVKGHFECVVEKGLIEFRFWDLEDCK